MVYIIYFVREIHLIRDPCIRSFGGRIRSLAGKEGTEPRASCTLGHGGVPLQRHHEACAQQMKLSGFGANYGAD